MSEKMAVVVRVKRQFTDNPVEGLVICQHRKTGGPQSPPIPAIAKFACTIELVRMQ